jgi:hypothetical protein|tara:strand:+ start:272 stop:631 length:360 start_codon:yes stop_codon:yes gene_type:complete
MTTINDNHDTSRDIYISHKLYLEKRSGNRYYNLGYMMYKEITKTYTTPTTIGLNYLLHDAIVNFDIALLFNKNDVDAKARKNNLCDKYGPNGTLSTGMTTDLIKTWKNEANTKYRNCKC